MGKIAFLFSGQGAQYVGMGKDLFENIDVCKNVFKDADEVLDFSISNMCFEGPEEDLNKTENTQPAILTTSIAALRALEGFGIKPDIAAGLSLGEYSALVCSGVMEFKEAVSLVKKRGKYMQEAVPEGIGTMAAILGLDYVKVEKICADSSSFGIVETSNMNCPGQVVIGGEIEAVKAACKLAKERGARRAIELSVSGPFHTSMLKPAAEKLEGELNKLSLKEFSIPVVTNVTGEVIEKLDNVKPYLKRQVMSTVLFEKSINTMIEAGADTFVEIGPGKVLSGFVRKIDRKALILNVQDIKSLNSTVEELKNR
ncbi:MULTISPECIES: ACP S-malonyltransferase [Clostridium]|uniref:Malonyl CoA-acyl carrier protein transacylase n=2 Tax=Clostridium TaxID=1485 RepID=D8GJD8_CLOLD|nr:MULTISPECIES: ACP S-malonyltransferase [Clostridium]ADK17226.1 malonyl-CoA-acyl carrier protein transacylase [Clostridium ljungdahlii DSM 13528]ALU36427.1 ACP S-malonyltransferase [Clostridium autoethanogenum DSM 10061]OAA84597.1 Malonyl CoA-acyl carrier protein transacylase [Clostridium ljungdahlii DSM 13528]OVY49001.1 Malonyl CoA-acyl carrier protein transacylase [Clostridium autoethanogenum]RMD01439.1 [acyl-carrier-protein] S-malonyltransferase [Clostridium autoethanogenum]